MRKNIALVVAAFLDGRAATGDAKRTCSTDGKAIYSYAFCMARKKRGEVVMCTRNEAVLAARRATGNFTHGGATTGAQWNTIHAILFPRDGETWAADTMRRVVAKEEERREKAAARAREKRKTLEHYARLALKLESAAE